MEQKKLPDWSSSTGSKLAASKGQIDLWLIDLNPTDFNFEALPQAVFAKDEQERAGRFRFDRHRRQYLVGRLALRTILARYTDQSPHEIPIAYGEYGKPYLKQNPAQLEFNLSNSNEMALVALTQHHKIGADIEYQERKLWDVDSLAKTVFTDQEVAELNEYSAEERLVPFLSGWTRKEAYLKAIGKGLALPLKEFSVQLKNELVHPEISSQEWSLCSFWSTDEYLSAVAYPADFKNPKFRWFRFSDSI